VGLMSIHEAIPAGPRTRQRHPPMRAFRPKADFQTSGATEPGHHREILDQQGDAGLSDLDAGVPEPRDASLPGGLQEPSDAGAQAPAPTADGGGPTPGPAGSAAAPPAAPAAPAAPAVAVTFGRVRAASTPAAMTPDRIPPRVNVPIRVSVAHWAPPMLMISISVQGSGGANGSATVDGRAATNVGTGRNVQLRGTAQTSPGNAGNLQLIATMGPTVVGASNAFSVAAIPENMRLVNRTALTGARRGFAVRQSWKSDSGVVGDLDQAQISEQVEQVSATGIFSGLGSSTSGYIAADTGLLTDTHGTPTSALTAAGTRRANQTEMFLDNRTGVADIPMRASGFIINRAAFTPAPHPGAPAPALRFTTSKAGAPVTANGVASSAGAGSMTLTQTV
jgi:hypothetical protein